MKVIRPQLPKILKPINDVALLFRDEDDIVAVSIEAQNAKGFKMKSLSLSEAFISLTDMSHMTLERFGAMDIIVKSCDLSGSQFPHSSWHAVLIDASRCSGVQLQHSTLKNVIFSSSKLEIVNFRFSILENIIFEDCSLKDVDFYNAKLNNIEFLNCTIDGVSFESAKISNVDLSGSQILDLKGIASIKGVTISYDQLMQLAPMFASETGIKIK